MSAVTLLLLRLFTGLGVILLLSGCGMIFVYWREDWKLRLTGFICGLVGLFMVVGFEMKLFAYEQSVELIRASRILEGRSNFAGALMLKGKIPGKMEDTACFMRGRGRDRAFAVHLLHGSVNKAVFVAQELQNCIENCQ